MNVRNLLHQPSSAERRKYILAYLSLPENAEGLPVNNRYQFNTNYDKDLQLLLKKGLIKRKRVSRFRHLGYKNSFKGQTYLVLA